MNDQHEWFLKMVRAITHLSTSHPAEYEATVSPVVISIALGAARGRADPAADTKLLNDVIAKAQSEERCPTCPD